LSKDNPTNLIIISINPASKKKHEQKEIIN